jgi:hypothetical protein
MYSMAQAAKAVGKSKSTILRAIKSGKLSANKNAHEQYEISPSELHRVYPIASHEALHEPVDDAPRTTSDATGEAAEMALKLVAAEKERDAAQNLAEERARTIDDLRSRLDTEGEERRKLTAMLTDQRPKGFWARFRGS